MNSGIYKESIKLDENRSMFELQIGNLVWWTKEELLVFRDAYGHHHELHKIMFLKDVWNDDEGVKDLPKPNQVDENNEIIDVGDKLLYTFVGHKDHLQIIILGSLANYVMPNFDNDLDTDVKDLDSIGRKQFIRNNKLRYLQVTDDSEGNVILHLETKEEGKGNFIINVKGVKAADGNYKQETNKKIWINQTNDEDEVINQLYMDNTPAEEKIKFVDKHKNVVQTTKEGILAQDTFKNFYRSTENGIEVRDRFGNFYKSTETGIEIKDSHGNDIKTDDNGITEKSIKNHNENTADKHTINAKESMITGGKHTMKGSCTPNGQGAYCAIKNCIYTGAPHVGDTVKGT